MDVLLVKPSVSSCHSGIAGLIHNIQPYSISKKYMYNTRVIYYKLFGTHLQHNYVLCYSRG